jgi:hypothetical protein
VKLTEDEREFLRVAKHTTSKPYIDVTRLVEAGYLTFASGRFGQFVKITEAGRKIAPDTARGDAGVGAGPSDELTPGAGPPVRRKALSGARKPDTVVSPSPQPPATPHEAGAVSNRASAPKAQPAPAIPSGRSRSASIGHPSPNAIRVTSGRRVTYYPLKNEGSLRGEKQRVVTSNKLLKSYPVEASAADVVVP